MPNDLLVQILNTRLEDEDCVTRGWIIFGLPLKNGPDLLGAFLAGSQVPNRIFVLGKILCILHPNAVRILYSFLDNFIISILRVFQISRPIRVSREFVTGILTLKPVFATISSTIRLRPPKSHSGWFSAKKMRYLLNKLKIINYKY